MDREEEFLKKVHKEIIGPLYRQKRFTEIENEISKILEDETDEYIRRSLISELSLFLHIGGAQFSGLITKSLHWENKLIEEFPDDPSSWSSLAGWYFYSPVKGHPTKEEMEIALGHYETALKKAYAGNEWVRNIMFYICRLMAKMEDYDGLDYWMREALKDMKVKRTYDIPQFECEWLNYTPEDKIDPDLAETVEKHC